MSAVQGLFKVLSVCQRMNRFSRAQSSTTPQCVTGRVAGNTSQMFRDLSSRVPMFLTGNHASTGNTPCPFSRCRRLHHHLHSARCQSLSFIIICLLLYGVMWKSSGEHQQLMAEVGRIVPFLLLFFYEGRGEGRGRGGVGEWGKEVRESVHTIELKWNVHTHRKFGAVMRVGMAGKNTKRLFFKRQTCISLRRGTHAFSPL